MSSVINSTIKPFKTTAYYNGKFVPVKNVELWKRLDELLQTHRVHFSHVKGHAGHVENERCDQLAVAAYQRFLKR